MKKSSTGHEEDMGTFHRRRQGDVSSVFFEKILSNNDRYSKYL